MTIKYAHRGARDFDSLLRAIDQIIKSIDDTKFDKDGGTINSDVIVKGDIFVSGSQLFGTEIITGTARIHVSGSVFNFQQYDGANWITLGTIP